MLLAHSLLGGHTKSSSSSYEEERKNFFFCLTHNGSLKRNNNNFLFSSSGLQVVRSLLLMILSFYAHTRVTRRIIPSSFSVVSPITKIKIKNNRLLCAAIGSSLFSLSYSRRLHSFYSLKDKHILQGSSRSDRYHLRPLLICILEEESSVRGQSSRIELSNSKKKKKKV